MIQTEPTGTIRLHCCIMGFTQTEQRSTGMLSLSERLIALGFNNCVTRVKLYRWNENWSSVAEYFWKIARENNATVIVNIYAYSWGMGWGAVQLSRELKKRGIDVHIIVSCDGVYRHRWLRLPAMLGRDSLLAPTIRIPSNVAFVIPFHQNENRPQGHRIEGDSDFSGVIYESRLLEGLTHQYMDDSYHFHLAAIHAARKLHEVTL